MNIFKRIIIRKEIRKMLHELDDLEKIYQFCKIPKIADWLTVTPSGNDMYKFENDLIHRAREEMYGSVPKHHFTPEMKNIRVDIAQHQSVLRRIMDAHNKHDERCSVLTYAVTVNNANKEFLCLLHGNRIQEYSFCVYDNITGTYSVMTIKMKDLPNIMEKHMAYLAHT